MQVRLPQLAAHLAKGLAPLYVIHGDEPLLAIEAGDLVRAAARAAGFDEREILVAEPGFKWDAFAAANRNLGLFGARKLVDLRVPSGKPGNDGARVLEDCATHPALRHANADHTAASGSSGTVLGVVRRARARRGHASPFSRSNASELPRWLAARLARQKQRASADTLQFLADTTEGNLLAAMQEVEKLGPPAARGRTRP